MADWKSEHPDSSSPASPGLGGAIKDAIGAVAKTFGPSSVTQIKQRTNAAVDDDSSDDSDSIGRMRAAQSTDKDNSYQY